MKALNVKLADYLEVDGWDFVRNHVENLECWADEIWELKSRWSPEGAVTFVTLLVDPMWEGIRRKGQGVCAVGWSAQFPRDRAEAARGGILNLTASKDEIEDFVALIDNFRTSLGSE